MVRKSEATRLSLLGNSFIELGNALQKLEVEQPRQQTDVVQGLYNRVYQQVCSFCPKESWCWDTEGAYTLEALGNACQFVRGTGFELCFGFYYQISGPLRPNRTVGIGAF